MDTHDQRCFMQIGGAENKSPNEMGRYVLGDEKAVFGFKAEDMEEPNEEEVRQRLYSEDESESLDRSGADPY